VPVLDGADTASILVSQAGPAIAGVLSRTLRDGGWDVAVAESHDEALAAVRNQTYALVVVDLTAGLPRAAVGSNARADVAVSDEAPPRRAADTPDAEARPADASDALSLIRAIRRLSPVTRIAAIVGGRADLETCCRAVTLGVCTFIEWVDGKGPIALTERIEQAIEHYRACLHDSAELHRGEIFDETGLAGQSRAMADLLLQARRAAMISDVPVLIHGESGTGKQLVAEAIHRLDPKRSAHPFLSVNCAAIHGTLAESALFGHMKGAYTGATEARQGYFRAAGGGTILLDEISELDDALQPKLLRVLQVGKVMPVGSDKEVDVTARVVAASNRPLPAMIEAGRFRLDLYQRLNVIGLSVPPLRDRPEDVPLLTQFFLRKYASYYPAGITSVDPRVYEVLAQSVGSGNVRELENTVRQILAFKRTGHVLELSDLPREILERRTQRKRAEQADIQTALGQAVCAMIRSGRWTLQQMLDEFERLAIQRAVSSLQGTHAQVAERLGITRRTLYNKMQKYDLPGHSSS
jgi:DNA-binding NtrC family response regulator